MAPSHILQIFRRVAVQNQIRIAQWVVVDEVVQFSLLGHGHIQRILDPGTVDGDFSLMAAVMVGGMTPPCAIALASLLFKDKFTKEEREAGPTNFIMGLAFITEGAIPYAAADPLHVLPSCIVGSAVAGALSMAFGCTLMAPHGGIFVFPVVGNALMYLVALVVGTLISAVLLGVLKKKVA